MRAAAALALLVLAACATPSEPVEGAPHLAWPVAADAAPAGSPSLGVGEIRDGRPAALRAGGEPALELRFFGLVREGTVRAGDESLDRPATEAVREDTVATLARSGAFASVVAVDFDPRDASAWPASGAPDAVLVGELQELSGTQWRSFMLTPFRVGFLRDRWGEPEGRFAASYELWTHSGRLWHGRVRTRVAPAEGDPATAALDALAHASEALAARLAAALRPPDRAARSLPLLVLDGCGLGEPAAERPLDDASAIFLREADVAFAPSYRAWSPPDEAHDLDALLDAARAVPPPGGGVVLALVPADRVREPVLRFARTGLAEPLGAHAIALCPDEGAPSALTAAHELAHLFGAVHVRERASIMNPTADFEASFFDPLNRRILRELRLRDFGRPLDARESARLRAIYSAAEGAPEAVDAAELDAAVRALDAAAR